MRTSLILFLLLFATSGHAQPHAEKSQTAVMIHGCHLEAIEWERIVFGTQERWGRVPTGLQEAIKRDAQAIFWGTGASEINGIREAQVTYDLAIGEKLQELSCWLGIDSEKLEQYVTRRSFIDTESTNTAEELKEAINTCHKLGINTLILVSSPTHIARCLQEACKMDTQGITVYATPSQTCFYGSTAADVTIFEPPHRPESFHLPPFHKTVKRLFGFYNDPERAWQLHRDLEAILTNHEGVRS